MTIPGSWRGRKSSARNSRSQSPDDRLGHPEWNRTIDCLRRLVVEIPSANWRRESVRQTICRISQVAGNWTLGRVKDDSPANDSGSPDCNRGDRLAPELGHPRFHSDTGRFSSAVPLVGAVCLGTGAVLLPGVRPYAWVAILLDYGTLALLLGTPTIAREAWATCRINLLEEYVGQRGITTVSLRLFRRGVFSLRWDIKRPPGELGIGGMGASAPGNRKRIR